MPCQAQYRKNNQQCKSKKGKKYKTEGGGYIILCGLHDRQYRKQTISSVSEIRSGRGINLLLVDNPLGTDIYSYVTHIYPNQKTAANEIIDKFGGGEGQTSKMVTLVAQMQCGKTGTMQATIAYFRERMHRDVVPFIIIPVHDNEVLSQARKDFTYDGLVEFDNIFGTTEIGRVQYLKDSLEHIGDKKKLLIIDESHMRSGKDTSLDLFLKKAGIYINGDQIRDDVYILTVSATPNAETALLTYREVRAKKNMVVLIPPDCYYGVLKMINLNRLRTAWSLTAENGVERLIEVIDQFMNQQKYMIIRCHITEVIRQVREALMDQYGDNVKIIDYSAKNTNNDINTIVSVEPAKPTVILLAQRLRASKRLDTQHVSMCFSWCDNISTTVQGLLGRNCGPFKEDNNVTIYTNMEHAKLYSNWCENMYNPFGTPSDKYVSNGVTSKTVAWNKNIPVELTLDQEAVAMIVNLGDNQSHYSYGHMRAHFTQLWNEQYPRLALRYPVPIKSNGITVMTEGHSAESTLAKFWTPQLRAHAQRTKIIGFETSQIKREIESGWYMFINRTVMRCIVCYTHREKHSAEPTVSDDCSFKPSGTLTRVVRVNQRVART